MVLILTTFTNLVSVQMELLCFSCLFYSVCWTQQTGVLKKFNGLLNDHQVNAQNDISCGDLEHFYHGRRTPFQRCSTVLETVKRIRGLVDQSCPFQGY